MTGQAEVYAARGSREESDLVHPRRGRWLTLFALLAGVDAAVRLAARVVVSDEPLAAAWPAISIGAAVDATLGVLALAGLAALRRAANAPDDDAR